MKKRDYLKCTKHKKGYKWVSYTDNAIFKDQSCPVNNVSRNHIKEFSFLFIGQRSDFGQSQETLGNHSENGEARTVGKGFLCNHEIS